MQPLELVPDPGNMTILARFCQHCIGSLLNIINIADYLQSTKWFSSPVLERALNAL